MNQTLFSIIIPIYNVERYLRTCIESVLHQSYNNWEIVLVDDGSPDNCPNICNEYAAKDKRIKVIHKKNGGLSDARNFGIKSATGDYLLFLDSDDYWEGTDNLKNIANKLKVIEYDVLLFKRNHLYQDMYLVKPKKSFNKNFDGKIKDQIFYKLIKDGEFECSACLKVIKKSILIENELYFTKGIKSEDVEWYMRVLLHINTFGTIENAFYVYRVQRKGSITNTGGIDSLKDLINIIIDRRDFIEGEKANHSSLFYECYLSYLAYQLSIVIGNYNFLIQQEQFQIKKIIKELSPLLKNNLFKQTRIVYFLYEFLGLDMTSKILGYYMKLRIKGKI